MVVPSFGFSLLFVAAFMMSAFALANGSDIKVDIEDPIAEKERDDKAADRQWEVPYVEWRGCQGELDTQRKLGGGGSQGSVARQKSNSVKAQIVKKSFHVLTTFALPTLMAMASVASMENNIGNL
jgi:hypothetical protein